MTEHRGRHREGAAGGSEADGFDREIDLKSVLSFVAALALTMIVVLSLLWVLMGYWKRRWAARDPRPSPIAEANAPAPPPEPRLQSAPVQDMEALREREASILASYGWVDRKAEIGRIPIDRAMDLLVESGLPATGRPGTPAARPAAAPGDGSPRARRRPAPHAARPAGSGGGA